MISITRYPKRAASPLDSFLSIQENMDRLFNAYYNPEPTAESIWTPPVDIYENESNFYLKMELAGVEQKDIQIFLENNILNIKGERKEAKQEGQYYKLERFAGTFDRKFNLPMQVDSEKVTASYKNGVLEVVLPKKEEKKPKLITIKTD